MSYGYYQGFLDGSVGKESICNVGDSGDAGLIPASGRSPGAEDGNALQYPCLKVPMNRRAWWDIVQRVTKSQTRLSMHNDMVIIIFLKVVPCPLPSCFIPSSEILFPHSYLKQRGNGPSSVTASRLSRGIDSAYQDAWSETEHFLLQGSKLAQQKLVAFPGGKSSGREKTPWRESSGSTFGVTRRWDMTATRSLACHHSFLIMLFLLFLLNLVSTVKNTEVCVSKKA